MRLPVAARLAWRDLRGGLGGYWIFLACIALGVMAIAGVGSVAGSLATGLDREGRAILGGDVAVSTVSQPLDPAQGDFLAARGRVSRLVTVRSMARHGDANPALVDVKAVDGLYPAVGALVLDPPLPLGEALAPRDGLYGLVAEEAVVARLGLVLGDEVGIGTGRFVLRAILRSEPDKLAGGMAFAPRVMVSEAALAPAGLLQPGSLARFTTRLLLGAPGEVANDGAVKSFVEEARAAFPGAGWEIKTRNAVSPEFDRNLGRFTQFLTLVGLTALVVGGVGVANAVKAAMERKRASLAVLKALGAPGRTVFALGLVQVLLVAVLGIAAGLAAGAALPFVLVFGFGPLLPFPLAAGLFPGALGLAALFGLLTTLVFSVGALGRVHDVPVSALFRDAVAPERTALRRPYRLALGLAVAALVAAAIGFSGDGRLAFFYILGVAAVFALLRLVAFAFMRGARALPRPRNVGLRLALANIHRPGALTPAVMLSLGLGLTLLVTLALIDHNIHRQIDEGRPGVTPSFFFTDVSNRQADAFAAFVSGQAPGATLDAVPILRGRITALNGAPVETIKAKDGSAWVLEGDRGITYAEAPPKNSRVVDGQWWPADYHGAPLVSFDKEMADGLGLKRGDRLTVNVLGRPVTATIANLRKVDWQSLGINFVMVFSPNTFAGAPHMVLSAVALPGGGDAAREAALARAVGQAFPTVTIIRVKDVLDTVNQLVGKLAVATRTASAVTILASVLVLSGALAAGRRARDYDAVMLKVLGATRGRLLGAMLLEYGMLGLAAALFGVAAGAAAAAVVVERVMSFDFAFSWPPALEAAGLALLVTVGLGLAGTWRSLGRSPAAFLRER